MSNDNTDDDWNDEINIYSVNGHRDRVGEPSGLEVNAEYFQYKDTGDGDTSFRSGFSAVYRYTVEDGVAQLGEIEPEDDEHFQPIHLRAIKEVEHVVENQPGVESVERVEDTLGAHLEEAM